MTRKSRKCVVTKAGQALECFHLQIERARRKDLKVSYLSAHVPRYLTFDADDIEILQGQMFVKSHLAFSSSSSYPFRTYLMIDHMTCQDTTHKPCQCAPLLPNISTRVRRVESRTP
ncbi:hypothetical protein V1477_018644 [Vespula maculifrons]